LRQTAMMPDIALADRSREHLDMGLHPLGGRG
jgi:hypothetical protein